MANYLQYFDTLRPTVEEKAKDTGFLYLDPSKVLEATVGSDSMQVGGANGNGNDPRRSGHANGRTNGHVRGGSAHGGSSNSGSILNPEARAWRQNGGQNGGHNGGHSEVQQITRYSYVEDEDDNDEDEIATQRGLPEDSPAALHANRSQMFRQGQAQFERPGSTGSHRRTNTLH